MMAHANISARPLIELLPPVRGRLSADAPLAHLTWFRVGGPAEVLFRPADEDDLAAFLSACPIEIPVTVVGATSNLLIRDGGIPGVVIRLGKGFHEIIAEEGHVAAGAAALDVNVARAAAEAGIAGLEFMCGIPGAVGGGIAMNAGCYGQEFKDCLVEATFIDRTGSGHILTVDELEMGYRHCGVMTEGVFTAGLFRGQAGDGAAILARMDEITHKRAATQPLKTRTGGSTFRNPEGHSAWRLIHDAGCRGLTQGGAQVSELHCNFLVNTGAASASDIEALGEEVRRRVADHCGIHLEWEIRRIGAPRAGAP